MGSPPNDARRSHRAGTTRQYTTGAVVDAGRRAGRHRHVRPRRAQSRGPARGADRLPDRGLGAVHGRLRARRAPSLAGLTARVGLPALRRGDRRRPAAAAAAHLDRAHGPDLLTVRSLTSRPGPPPGRGPLSVRR
ncbi:hypothetical protein Ae150APs1_2968 [Pseudonocardia sp. Ae150A_Ps1]|nr:hypothetical protein Ae150APs1_2968 [Pseudonocardia sp. Ae150A_Ps1]